MVRAACVMMQRDERVLLEPWLVWHGALFGYRNLYVLDNGSTDPGVLLTLALYAGKGVRVNYARPGRANYLRKGELIGAVIRTLQARGGHDFFFPTDCDEFLLLRDGGGVCVAPEALHAHLATLAGEARTLRIPFQFANDPTRPDHYRHFDFVKTFYAAGAFAWTDHGHHKDGSRARAGFRDTEVLHAHFHHRAFAEQVALARRKWHGSVDPDDKAALRDYVGDSMHLAPLLLMDAAQYEAQFNAAGAVHLPAIRARLAELGAPLPWPGLAKEA